jgi:hypothetical protein
MPQLPSTKTVIDGVEYQLTKLPTGQALPVFNRIRTSLLPALLEAAKAKEGDDRAGVAALEKLSDSVDSATLDALITAFRAYSAFRVIEPGGERWPGLTDQATYDHHFSDKGLLHLMKWLRACIEYNFADFLAAFRDMRAKSAAGSAANPKA